MRLQLKAQDMARLVTWGIAARRFGGRWDADDEELVRRLFVDVMNELNKEKGMFDQETIMLRGWALDAEHDHFFRIAGRTDSGETIYHAELYPVYWCRVEGDLIVSSAIDGIMARARARHGLAEAERKAAYREARDEQ